MRRPNTHSTSKNHSAHPHIPHIHTGLRTPARRGAAATSASTGTSRRCAPPRAAARRAPPATAAGVRTTCLSERPFFPTLCLRPRRLLFSVCCALLDCAAIAAIAAKSCPTSPTNHLTATHKLNHNRLQAPPPPAALPHDDVHRRRSVRAQGAFLERKAAPFPCYCCCWVPARAARMALMSPIIAPSPPPFCSLPPCGLHPSTGLLFCALFG